jgi:archaellum biogenesis protein FlaJ (TadC family)
MHSPRHQDLSVLDALVLTVRFLLELAAFGALAWWGIRSGETMAVKVLLGAGAPLAMAVVWGAFIAPKASFAVPAPVHLALQLTVLAAAAGALVAIQEHTAAEVLAVTAVVNGAALYALEL